MITLKEAVTILEKNKNFAVAVSVMADDDIPEEHFTYRPSAYPESEYQRKRGVPLFVKYEDAEVISIGYNELRNKFTISVQMPEEFDFIDTYAEQIYEYYNYN